MIDQLAESYHSFSPYVYVANSPLTLIDPDGRDIAPVSGGWEFTGTDIKLIISYFQSGGGFNNLTNQLQKFQDGGGFNGPSYALTGGINGFWLDFNGGDVFGGVKIANGSLTWWTNGSTGPNGTGAKPIQELIAHKTQLDQNKFNLFMGPQLSMSNYNFGNNAYESSFTRDFIEGFKSAPDSNLSSPSSWLGALGLNMSQYEGLLAKTSKFAPAQYAKLSSQGLKYLKPLGKTLGLVGASLTLYEGATDGNGLTAGDIVKVGIGIVTIFTPYGWAYAAVDLGVGMVTGTTLTDRIGAGIDNTIMGRW